MSMDRLEQIDRLLHEALEEIEPTRREPRPGSTPIRQALALAREMHDELNPAYPNTPAPWAPS